MQPMDAVVAASFFIVLQRVRVSTGETSYVPNCSRASGNQTAERRSSGIPLNARKLIAVFQSFSVMEKLPHPVLCPCKIFRVQVSIHLHLKSCVPSCTADVLGSLAGCSWNFIGSLQASFQPRSCSDKNRILIGSMISRAEGSTVFRLCGNEDRR